LTCHPVARQMPKPVTRNPEHNNAEPLAAGSHFFKGRHTGHISCSNFVRAKGLLGWSGDNNPKPFLLPSPWFYYLKMGNIEFHFLTKQLNFA